MSQEDQAQIESQAQDSGKEQGFNQGYLQAMDLMMAHWPEDRKCRCNPLLSGQQGPQATHLIGHCTYYCWLIVAYRSAGTNAGEVRE